MTSYRPEIDGLRAIAVLTVLTFHLNSAWLPSGFIGVDIFFVISGFLITGIIRSELERGSFSIHGFYLKRVKRILPAYVFVLTCSTILALAILPPNALEDFTTAALASLFFVSNFYFAMNADYFDRALWDDPLLHTWSLAVEEQFYIFWPLLLLFMFSLRLKPRTMLIIVLAGIGASFALAEALVSSRLSTWAYYLFPTRAGELMFGALIAFLPGSLRPSGAAARGLAVAGLIILAVGLSVIDRTSSFPGLNALYPSIGTLFIILGTTESSWVRNALSLKPMVAIGKISYSLYLWHWPVLAFARAMNGSDDLTLLTLAICAAMSIVLAALTYFVIENPIRRNSWGLLRACIILLVVPGVALIGFQQLGQQSSGHQWRYPDPSVLERVVYQDDDFCHNDNASLCSLGIPDESPQAIIFGDSHAGHYAGYWDELTRALGVSAAIVSTDACYPLVDQHDGVIEHDPSLFLPQICSQQLARLRSSARDSERIILAAAWSNYISGNSIPENFDFIEAFQETLTYLKAQGAEVLVIAQIPTFTDRAVERFNTHHLDPFKLSTLLGFSEDIQPNEFSTDNSVAVANMLIEKTARNEGVGFWVPFATVEEELPWIEGRFAYRDSNHLNAMGSRLLAAQHSKAQLDQLGRWFQ